MGTVRDMAKIHSRTVIPPRRDLVVGELEELIREALRGGGGLYNAICWAYSAGYDAAERERRYQERKKSVTGK